ncbi:hypothetical protein N752_22235 [Desulforamulus aquiferis]|nr:hypothetical protein N752_22235 [Desulforamulus aquiferis]
MVPFYLSQLDYIIFLEGLFHLTLGVILCYRLDKEMEHKLPWFWLGMFFLIHGIEDWVNLITLSLQDNQILFVLRWGLMYLAVFYLFIFARRGCIRTHEQGHSIWFAVITVVLLSCLALKGLGLKDLTIYLLPFLWEELGQLL